MWMSFLDFTQHAARIWGPWHIGRAPWCWSLLLMSLPVGNPNSILPLQCGQIGDERTSASLCTIMYYCIPSRPIPFHLIPLLAPGPHALPNCTFSFASADVLENTCFVSGHALPSPGSCRSQVPALCFLAPSRGKIREKTRG